MGVIMNSFEFKQPISESLFFRKYGLHGESKAEEVFMGVAEEISSVEKDNKWKDIFYNSMISGEFIPAGRILANARPSSRMKNYNNCFTIDVEDSMEGIFDALKEDALISKMGGGVGFNASKIRPKGTPISKGGESSGVMSFLEIFDASAKSIHTGGGRRSAHISILNVDHPDIEEFITYKQGDENKRLTQFNISVGITDKFINAVENDEDWDLVFEGKVYKTIKARELYDKITKHAWWYNEPGVLFLDTVEKGNNGHHAFAVDRCNPCVAKGTLVNTPYGYKKVEDIKEGDLVSTLHKNGYEPVKTVEIHEDTFVNKVVFSDGTVQYITDAHIYHVKKEGTNKIERLRFDTLKIGDKIQHEPVEIFGNIDENSIEYKKALLAGILLGDGCYTEKSIDANNNIKISTSIDDTEYNENIISLIKEIGYVCGGVYNDEKNKSATISISNADEILKDLGLEKLYSFEKEIPEEYLNNKNKIAGVINGLIASDGNILVRSGTMPLVRVKTSSEKMYHSYRKALLNLGVKCGMYYGDKEKLSNGVIDGREIERKHSIYEAYTSGAMAKDLIRKLPENINPSKRDKMNDVLYNYTTHGNNYFLEIADIEWHVKKEQVYDLFCEESDTWITEGLVQQGCGEIVMPSYSLCCLSSINLSKLVKNPFTDIAEFDYGRFKELIHMGVRFLDNVLDVTEYPLEKIKQMSTQWRRIGLGITGLADAMLKLGIRYGGDSSIDFTSELGKVLAIESYTSSMGLAREKGSFPAFDENIGNYGFIKKLPKELQQDIKKYGLRNIGLNTTAPVGTTSLTVGNNCSSGIEPIFALQYDRTVRNDDNSTYTETVYDDGWLEYLQYCSDNHFEIDPNNLPEHVVTSHEVKIKEGIDVQASFQYWIDHSISRTINMPYETTLEEYKDIFMYAWQKGLKGITSFHEGASMAGVLSTTNKNTQRYAKKRPEILPCEIYEMQINKNRVIALVGLLDDRPYEVFLTDDPDDIINVKHAKVGNIVKVKTGKYDLHIESERGEYILHDISSVFDDEWGTLGRLVSMSLRHNVPLQFIVDQLSKTRQFNTFSKGMARVLKKYIKDGEKALSANKCPECGSELVFIEGCKNCPQCGFSKCD